MARLIEIQKKCKTAMRTGRNQLRLKFLKQKNFQNIDKVKYNG